MTMPEEVNRRVTDLLVRPAASSTSPEADRQPRATRASPAERIHFVGNPMIDTLLANLDRFDAAAARGRLRPRRAVRRRDPPPPGQRRRRPTAAAELVAMLDAVASPAAGRPAAPPARPGDARRRRPRATAPRLRSSSRSATSTFLSLVRGAALVVTDSGGIQEETTILGVPCLTVRPNTERPITITHGTNRLVEPEARRPRVARDPGATPAAAAGRPRRRRCGTATPASGSPIIVCAWLERRAGSPA